MRRGGTTSAWLSSPWWMAARPRTAPPVPGVVRSGGAGQGVPSGAIPLLVEGLRQAGARAERPEAPVVVVVRLGPRGEGLGADVLRAAEPGAAAVFQEVRRALAGMGGSRR
jgi:hypothetical protein